MEKEGGLPKKLELGCGTRKPEGFYGVDRVDTEATDLVQDLDSENWDLPPNHFEEIRAIDLFEHLENPVNFLEEVHRIAEFGAEIVIKAPHLSSQNWTDPTHKRLAGIDTISNYFTQNGRLNFYSDARFEIESIQLRFFKRKFLFYNYLIQPLVNSSRFTQMLFEKTFLSRFFPAHNIRFHLEKPQLPREVRQKLDDIGEGEI
jgi:hypothetical protein